MSPETSNSNTPARGNQRYMFLDVLRGIAVLWMIQTHVTNVILRPGEKNNIAFNLLNISNGFVAPAFIFCAGAGLYILLSRKGDAFLSMGRELGVYLRRMMYILFWAYMLHVPVFSMQWILQASGEQLIPWLMIDVLQTIVYASLIVLGIFLLSRKLSLTIWIVAALAVIIPIATPYIWASDPYSYLPAALAVPITSGLSPFPLLPFVAYFLVGFVVTKFFFGFSKPRKLAFWFVAAGFCIPVVLFIIKHESVPQWTQAWWNSSPQLVVFRIAGILWLWGVLFLFEDDMKNSKFASLLQVIGSESLFLYLSHVMIVYSALPAIMTAATGSALTGYAGVALGFVLLTTPLVLVALWWHGLKADNPVLARRLLAMQVAWMIISLLVTPAGFSMMELLSK